MSTARYAAYTSVPVERTRAEIEKTLTRYGADAFFYGADDKTGTTKLGFRLEGRMIRISIAVSGLDDRELRQRWRALLLVIKAKLEAAASGISTIEDEFLPHLVLPDGQTVGDFMRPQLALAYEQGRMPKLLSW